MLSYESVLVLNLACFLLVCAVPYYQTNGDNKIEQIDIIDILNLEEKQFAYELTDDIVRVDLYYESFCPDCIQEYPEILSLVQKFKQRIDLHTYPYGNARMKNENGKIVVQCQHGEKECYGNKLHACAIDLLKDAASYVPFISCLMAHGSQDSIVDTCSPNYKVDGEAVKTCAKGPKGEELLEYYGQESSKVHYRGVPYVLINAEQVPDNESLFDAVCAAFSKPPDVCNELTNRTKDSN